MFLTHYFIIARDGIMAKAFASGVKGLDSTEALKGRIIKKWNQLLCLKCSSVSRM